MNIERSSELANLVDNHDEEIRPTFKVVTALQVSAMSYFPVFYFIFTACAFAISAVLYCSTNTECPPEISSLPMIKTYLFQTLIFFGSLCGGISIWAFYLFVFHRFYVREQLYEDDNYLLKYRVGFFSGILQMISLFLFSIVPSEQSEITLDRLSKNIIYLDIQESYILFVFFVSGVIHAYCSLTLLQSIKNKENALSILSLFLPLKTAAVTLMIVFIFSIGLIVSFEIYKQNPHGLEITNEMFTILAIYKVLTYGLLLINMLFNGSMFFDLKSVRMSLHFIPDNLGNLNSKYHHTL